MNANRNGPTTNHHSLENPRTPAAPSHVSPSPPHHNPAAAAPNGTSVVHHRQHLSSTRSSAATDGLHQKPVGPPRRGCSAGAAAVKQRHTRRGGKWLGTLTDPIRIYRGPQGPILKQAKQLQCDRVALPWLGLPARRERSCLEPGPVHLSDHPGWGVGNWGTAANSFRPGAELLCHQHTVTQKHTTKARPSPGRCFAPGESTHFMYCTAGLLTHCLVAPTSRASS